MLLKLTEMLGSLGTSGRWTMSHESTRLMACERARGGQCIRVAVHRGSPRERQTEIEKKFFSVWELESRLG